MKGKFISEQNKYKTMWTVQSSLSTVDFQNEKIHLYKGC